MPYTLTIDFNRPMALFPLAQCVLLPHATIPLHIYEPRYRALTADALDSSGLVAMTTFQGDEYIQNYNGNPSIHDHVCVGYIVHHERMSDGRYNMLLQGIARAKIIDELEPHHGGYRQAILSPIDTGAMEIDLDYQRGQIETLLSDASLSRLASVHAIHNWLTPELPTSAVVDLVWQAVCDTHEQRYRMLAEPCALKRADHLIHHLRRTRQTLDKAQSMGPCMSEEGFPLN